MLAQFDLDSPIPESARAHVNPAFDEAVVGQVARFDQGIQQGLDVVSARDWCADVFSARGIQPPMQLLAELTA